MILVALIGSGFTQCIELKQSPFDTSQGGLLGFLTLGSRSAGLVNLVAAGNSGTVFTSNDGLSWSSTTLDSSVNFYNAVWTGSRWVLVGGSASTCTIFTSPDGSNWTAATTPVCTKQLLAVASNTDGSRIVAVGEPAPTLPAALGSTDGGSTWNTITSVGTYKYAGLVFANNLFVSLDDPNTGAPVAAYTSDGASGFVQSGASLDTSGKNNSFGAAIAVNNRVIVGLTTADLNMNMNSLSSLDNGATAWTGNLTNIFGGNMTNLYPRAFARDTAATVLVAVGDSCLVDRTTDIAGLNWTGAQNVMSGCAGINWKGLIHDGAKFVATGSDGGGVGYFAYSSTGNSTDWTIGSIGAISVNHVAIK